MVFGTLVLYYCILCQHLDLIFPIRDSILFSVNHKHHAKSGPFCKLFATVKMAIGTGYEYLLYFMAIQSLEPSFHMTQNYDPHGVLFSFSVPLLIV